MFLTNVAEKIKTHILRSITFSSENRNFYETVLKNIAEPGRPQMTIWRMRFACCIPKATNTHSEYVILIAFPLQQLLQKHASMLHYTHIVCPVSLYHINGQNGTTYLQPSCIFAGMPQSLSDEVMGRWKEDVTVEGTIPEF